jgi:glycosyltransferase involved in cell wall biosynthesis
VYPLAASSSSTVQRLLRPSRRASAGHQRPVVARLGLADLLHFTGWVDEADKPALYSMALGSVFVSEYEGFGLPVVAGMGAAGQLDRDR